jgi:hypothetical protein
MLAGDDFDFDSDDVRCNFGGFEKVERSDDQHFLTAFVVLPVG